MTSLSIADLRLNYTQAQLNETEVNPDPMRQFQTWFDQAVAAELPEPNAMTLATATPDGIPSARIVLLKGVDDRGFVFYTNYDSRKGTELSANPQAALVFLWTQLERQVRIEGQVEKVTTAETNAYFQSRPLASRLGAWASDQSQVIPSREVLEQRFQAVQENIKTRKFCRRRTGADFASFRTRSNSGRADRAACTIASAIVGKQAPGRSRGWLPERLNLTSCRGKVARIWHSPLS